MLPLFPYKRDVDMKDIRMTEEGAYSYTKREDGDRTIQFLKRFMNPFTLSILDGTGNIGGDTILFGLHFNTVHSIEIDPENFKAMAHNVSLYKLTNVHLYEGDSTKIYVNYPVDVLYLDPPWGGPDYKEKKNLDLWLGTCQIDEFLRDSVLAKDAPWKPQWIVLKLPFNYNWSRLDALSGISSISNLRIRNYRIMVLKVGDDKKHTSKTRRATRVVAVAGI